MKGPDSTQLSGLADLTDDRVQEVRVVRAERSVGGPGWRLEVYYGRPGAELGEDGSTAGPMYPSRLEALLSWLRPRAVRPG